MTALVVSFARNSLTRRRLVAGASLGATNLKENQ